MEVNYSEIIQQVICEQAELHKSSSVSIETIFDTQRHHYLLVRVGWVNGHWVYGCSIHLDWLDLIFMSRRKIPEEIQERVRQRSRHLCEYCHAWEQWQYVRFTVDHVVLIASMPSISKGRGAS
jgi:XisI protein